jgi:hypothetical protein
VGQRAGDQAGVAPSGRKQVAAAYYFPPKSGGKPAFTFWLAMERRALEWLQFISQSMCRFVSEPSSRDYVKVDIVQSMGTDVDEPSPAEAFETRMFIPAFHFSHLMNKRWDEIEEEIEGAGEQKLEAIEKEFCQKSVLLNMVMQGLWVSPDALEWNGNAPRGERYSVPPRARRPFGWINDDGGVSLYYVPVSYLP